MILDENFAILDEDEDFELLEEEDEILMEGEILDEGVRDKLTQRYKEITSASDIDKSNKTNIKNIQKIKSKIEKMKNKGYRDFDPSKDKTALSNKLKNKEFLSSLISEVLTGVSGGRNIRYKVFKFEGMTLLSLVLPKSKESRDTGDYFNNNVCYTLLVKENNNKLIFKRIYLYGKSVKVEDKIDM